MTKRELITNKDQFDSAVKSSVEIGKDKVSTFYRVTDLGKQIPEPKRAEQILNYIWLEVKCLEKSIHNMESNQKEWIKICGTKKGYDTYLSNQKARCASLGSVLFYAKYDEIDYSNKF